MKPIKCQYCGRNAKIVTGAALYPNRPAIALRQFARCNPCDAHVGFHVDGRVLGELANARLRTLRQHAHRRVDQMWIPFRQRTRMRQAVYGAMAQLLSIDRSACHISQLTEKQCVEVIRACKDGTLARALEAMHLRVGFRDEHAMKEL